MLKRYDTWVIGLKKLFFIALIVGATPLAITLLVTLILELILYVLPGQMFDPTKYYYEIYLASLLIFAPYYLEFCWPRITTLQSEPTKSVIKAMAGEYYGPSMPSGDVQEKKLSKFELSAMGAFLLFILYALFIH